MIQHEDRPRRIVGFPKHVVVNHYQSVGRQNHLTFGTRDRPRLGDRDIECTDQRWLDQVGALINVGYRDAPLESQQPNKRLPPWRR